MDENALRPPREFRLAIANWLSGNDPREDTPHLIVVMSGTRSLRLVAGLTNLLAPERSAIASAAPQLLTPGIARQQSGFRNPLRHRRSAKELASRLTDGIERFRPSAGGCIDGEKVIARRLDARLGKRGHIRNHRRAVLGRIGDDPQFAGAVKLGHRVAGHDGNRQLTADLIDQRGRRAPVRDRVQWCAKMPVKDQAHDLRIRTDRGYAVITPRLVLPHQRTEAGEIARHVESRAPHHVGQQFDRMADVPISLELSK